jgi:hypothetical protein
MEGGIMMENNIYDLGTDLINVMRKYNIKKITPMNMNAIMTTDDNGKIINFSFEAEKDEENSIKTINFNDME